MKNHKNFSKQRYLSCKRRQTENKEYPVNCQPVTPLQNALGRSFDRWRRPLSYTRSGFVIARREWRHRRPACLFGITGKPAPDADPGCRSHQQFCTARMAMRPSWIPVSTGMTGDCSAPPAMTVFGRPRLKGFTYYLFCIHSEISLG